MFYHTLAAIPSWAPSSGNHILYSSGVLRNVNYSDAGISYDAAEKTGSEYMRVSFKPSVMAKGASVKIRSVEGGDYYIVINRTSAGGVRILKAP